MFRGLLAAVAAGSLLLPGVAAAADQIGGVTPAVAIAGPPASVAVLGDSISAGTGADGRSLFDTISPLPGTERPNRSWATGDQYSDLQSVFQRTRALRPGQATTRANLAVNGARAQNIVGQVQGAPGDVGLILIQIGGNDLCRSTVEDMTSIAEYRAQIDATLAWVAQNRPDARVQINSVPDIYRLWEIRRTNAVAVTFWALGLIPCQSLLANPTSEAPADMARRDAVRARGLAYNEQLREACAQYLRCRYDDDATWLFSNDPAGFVNGDISSQDHFHPSYQGQQKLAAVSWQAGFDFTDAKAPTVSVATVPEANDAGWHAAPVDVEVSATDDAGVAGLEIRVHAPDGTVGPWAPVFDDRARVTVELDGTTHVEARAVDVNGNVSGSVVQTVHLDQVAPTVQVHAPTDDLEVVLGDEVFVEYGCDDDRSGVVACEGTRANLATLDTSRVGAHEFTVTATDAAGNVTTLTRRYRVVYAVAAAADRLEVDGPIRVNRNATLPVRVAIEDVAGAAVAGLSPALRLVAEDGTSRPAGALAFDAVEARYAAQVSLRGLGVAAGDHRLVADLDDGTERVIAHLEVR
ncbi:SGNH/GDSL hydrolase family protein [Egicoccus sp. AB-alg2]|uniref:SGNH/GDSL hydrolase family protein n=1 Tax=Egicoccus sp. AB-alg2 TaxID=3242693 RepID=UPI00359D863A